MNLPCTNCIHRFSHWCFQKAFFCSAHPSSREMGVRDLCSPSRGQQSPFSFQTQSPVAQIIDPIGERTERAFTPGMGRKINSFLRKTGMKEPGKNNFGEVYAMKIGQKLANPMPPPSRATIPRIACFGGGRG